MEIDEIEIIKLNMQEAYKLLNIITIENPNIKTQYEKIRNGIKLKFDIYNIFTENYTIKTKDNKIIMNKQNYKLNEFYTEIEKREALIKKIIIKSIKDTDIFEERSK